MASRLIRMHSSGKLVFYITSNHIKIYAANTMKHSSSASYLSLQSSYIHLQEIVVELSD